MLCRLIENWVFKPSNMCFLSSLLIFVLLWTLLCELFIEAGRWIKSKSLVLILTPNYHEKRCHWRRNLTQNQYLFYSLLRKGQRSFKPDWVRNRTISIILYGGVFLFHELLERMCSKNVKVYFLKQMSSLGVVRAPTISIFFLAR